MRLLEKERQREREKKRDREGKRVRESDVKIYPHHTLFKKLYDLLSRSFENQWHIIGRVSVPVSLTLMCNGIDSLHNIFFLGKLDNIMKL